MGWIALAAAILALLAAIAFVTHGTLWRRPKLLGCCTTCNGTGIDGTIESGGRCCDCYGTGHAHDSEQRCRRRDRIQEGRR